MIELKQTEYWVVLRELDGEFVINPPYKQRTTGVLYPTEGAAKRCASGRTVAKVTVVVTETYKYLTESREVIKNG